MMKKRFTLAFFSGKLLLCHTTMSNTQIVSTTIVLDCNFAVNKCTVNKICANRVIQLTTKHITNVPLWS